MPHLGLRNGRNRTLFFRAKNGAYIKHKTMKIKPICEVLTTCISILLSGVIFAGAESITVSGTLVDQGLRRNLKPKAGDCYENSPSGLARINVTQSIGKNRYLCMVVDHFDISVRETFLDACIIRSSREFVDGERLAGGIFQYVGTASYQTVMGAKKTVREFEELEGPKVQEYYEREAAKAKQYRAAQENANKERLKQIEMLNVEAMTNVQNFIKSLKLDLDPRNRIHVDKCLRDKLKVIVPNETKVAIEAKNVGDVGRLRGAEDLVKSYKENRQLTQEAALRFYNMAFRHLNQEVRMEWTGFGPAMQGEGKERVAPTLAIIRIHGQDERLAKVCYKNDSFTPFVKTDSHLRKPENRNRYADTETRINDDLNGDLMVCADMSFDKTEALFVFCVNGNESKLEPRIRSLMSDIKNLKALVADGWKAKQQELDDAEANLKRCKGIEDEVYARKNWAYGFKRAEAAFNAIAPKHEELEKQLKREEISKEDFEKRSIELKKELYAALIKACENEGVEKVVAEKRETESTVAKERKDITAVAKKRFVEQVDPRNRVYIDNAITNNVCALVPKKIREGIDALRNGNFTFFAAISNPNNGMLSDNEIKQIDLAIKRLSREVRLECRHGHPGVIIFKVHMGDDEWMELSGKKHGHDDFVKYGLIDFEMDQEFDRVYNNMRESYSHVKLQHEAGSVFLKESVPIDERMFVFGRGTSGFEFAIKAFTGAIAWKKKLYDQRCLSKARDDDSFTEEEYKKKIGELKVKFCEYLKKAVDM